MSGRRQRVATGVTNGLERRPGTASAQLTARLSARNGSLTASSSVPLLPSHASARGNNQSENQQLNDRSLPHLNGPDGARPSTSTGVSRTPFTPVGVNPPVLSSRQRTPPGGKKSTKTTSPGSNRGGGSGDMGQQLFTPGRGENIPEVGIDRGWPSDPTHPPSTWMVEGTQKPRSAAQMGVPSGTSVTADLPLGLSKLCNEELEVYVNMVRKSLSQQADSDVGSSTPMRRSMGLGERGPEEPLARARNTHDSRSSRPSGQGGKARATKGGRRDHSPCHPGRVKKVHRGDRRDAPPPRGNSLSPQGSRESMSGVSGGSFFPGKVDGGSGGGGSFFARSKSSVTLPLRTLLLDPSVNNIPHVKTLSDYRSMLKVQNIPHESYDIDGDGVVSQEDYALAKRFDVNGDGVLDEAEKVIGRRIMAENFLEGHPDDLHLYGNGMSNQSMAENVDQLSRSRGFKKIMSTLLEKEKHFDNHASKGVSECVTLGNTSLTRHNWFADKFDTTAWNDFTRDPRPPSWMGSQFHDGSRNQLNFMRKAVAREVAQSKLTKSYERDPHIYSTKRITLITDPAIENS